MKHVSVKSVPKLLPIKQKQTHLAAARYWLQCADQGANFTKTTVTSDEPWVYGYNPETKAQSSQLKHLRSSRLKKKKAL
jgi:hypothetical protein